MIEDDEIDEALESLIAMGLIEKYWSDEHGEWVYSLSSQVEINNKKQLN